MQNPNFGSKPRNSGVQGPEMRKNQKIKNLIFPNFSFFVITRNQSVVYGPDLVEIDPRSLPQLSKRLRDLNFSQKAEKTELQNLEKIIKFSY